MITHKELKIVDSSYFKVQNAGAFTVSVQSRNTGHYWHILEEEFTTFRHFIIYHKHNAYDSYHTHGSAGTLAGAIEKIQSHDTFQLNGRKRVH